MSLDQNHPKVRAAVEAAQRGDLKGEYEILDALNAEYPDDANLLLRLGTVVAHLGDRDQAETHLRRAITLAPNLVNAWIMLGRVCDRNDNRAEALRCFKKIVELAPNTPEAHLELGNHYQAAGDVDAARRAFEKAIDLNPEHVNALVLLASLHEREHEFDEAKGLAERAVALAPDHGQANITLARVELRLGLAKEAAGRMQLLLSRARLGDLDSGLALYLIGQAVEKIGDHEHAFVAFENANNTFHTLYGPSIAATDSALTPHNLRRVHDYFSTADIGAWTKVSAPPGPTPVFLLGFPRSGTTLLDQILSAHSEITTLEEMENFLDARNDFIRPAGGLEKLGAMSDDEIKLYREKYWARVRENYSGDPEKGVIIDKMPLNTVLLGVIYRLFPDAKIIFALRDPRDVVLSCFQQRFGINVAMYQLLKLDTAAAYYDQVMGIGEACRTRLPLNVHMVKYEDVVNDLRGAASGVLSFLGLDWEDDMLNYRQKARDRWITTPSAEQVVEPLYTSSIGKWRNYEKNMQAVLPTLAPWVGKFGYPSS